MNREGSTLLQPGCPSGLGVRKVNDALPSLPAGVPIDHYPYEAVELLKDVSARWRSARRTRELATCTANSDLPVCRDVSAPDAEIFAIDVSFAALQDKAERDYLNAQPTSFVLGPEAVDRLRAAAGKIIAASPERLLEDAGARLMVQPTADGAGVAPGARSHAIGPLGHWSS